MPISPSPFWRITAACSPNPRILSWRDRVPGKPDKIRKFSPELPYETRYFTVQLNEEGVILSTNTGRIAAIDSETAMEFARTIWEKQSTRGFLGDYRYLVHANDQGYQIIFLDCGRNLDSYRNFMAQPALESASAVCWRCCSC